jgi:ABC-type phosphate transport system auxiliary subunit
MKMDRIFQCQYPGLCIRLSHAETERDRLSEGLTKAVHELSEMGKRLSEVTAERDALREEAADLRRHTWCAYCGHEIAMDDNSATLIGEHIRLCEKHPMRKVETERDALKKRVEKLEAAMNKAIPFLKDSPGGYGLRLDFAAALSAVLDSPEMGGKKKMTDAELDAFAETIRRA